MRSPKSTRVEIQDALLDLLETTSLAQVSVADIIRAAHVSRSTFYYHYQDKDDVVDGIIERAHALAKSVWPNEGATDEELLAWFDDFTGIVQENGPFYRSLVLGGLFQRATSFEDQSQIDAVHRMTPESVPEGDESGTFVQARAHAISWIVEGWIRNDFETPRQEIIRLTWALFRPSLKPADRT